MRYAVVTGGSRNDYDAIATVIVNMTKVMPALQADYIIFHDGLSKEQQKRLQEYHPVRFFRYYSPIPVFAKLFCASVRYFTPMLYCKYECFRLLDTYDKVMWTDYDVIFKEDISDLFDMDRKAVFVTNGHSKVIDMFYVKYRERAMRRMSEECDLQADAIATPLFFVSKDIGNYMELYQWCNEATVKFFRYLEQSEQAVISMMLQKYHIFYGELSDSVYALHPKYDNSQAKIVHAYGQPKFWNGCYDRRWEKYNQIWNDFKNVAGKAD